jgi:hypothetical protein
MVLFTHQYCTLGKGDLLRELEAVQAILVCYLITTRFKASSV